MTFSPWGKKQTIPKHQNQDLTAAPTCPSCKHVSLWKELPCLNNDLTIPPTFPTRIRTNQTISKAINRSGTSTAIGEQNNLVQKRKILLYLSSSSGDRPGCRIAVLGTVKPSFEPLKTKHDRARERCFGEHLCSKIMILLLVFQIILAPLCCLLPIRIPNGLGKEETNKFTSTV